MHQRLLSENCRQHSRNTFMIYGTWLGWEKKRDSKCRIIEWRYYGGVEGLLGRQQCLGEWHVSRATHIDARTQSFPTEHCTVTRGSVLSCLCCWLQHGDFCIHRCKCSGSRSLFSPSMFQITSPYQSFFSIIFPWLPEGTTLLKWMAVFAQGRVVLSVLWTWMFFFPAAVDL